MNTRILPETELQAPSPSALSSVPVWIEVNLEAIRQNIQQIKQFIGPRVKLLGVIKANAYGHGLLPIGWTLAQAGVDFLGVASVLEAVKLRGQGINGKILVLGQLLPEEAPLVIENRLIQAAGDRESIAALSAAASRAGTRAEIHLKVDTGMSRYGVWWEQARALAEEISRLPNIRVAGILTHLSMAGQNTDAVTEQLQRFSSVVSALEKDRFPVGLKHAANSVSLLKFPGSHWDLVRSGLLLYGCSPLKDSKGVFPLRPALSLKSRIRFLKTIPQGRGVSYGGTYQASRLTKVATIPVGYAHGYPRALSNRSSVLVRGLRAQVIGKITMEDLMLDVTDIPQVRVGDEVVLIGRQGSDMISAEELARHARSIPYEILAGLSANIPRRYLG
ncbi:MAG: alanine racemase [Candidatus Omnitrophica bacterium]|nr:alanine racemase [Candidatus Omnitrophota bacterium]